MVLIWKVRGRKKCPRQIEGVKHQLRSYISQLWTIRNPLVSEFAVGTLCSTHELLNDPFLPHAQGSFYKRNGPFKTIEEYRNNVEYLYGRIPKFPKDAGVVFDHMDWHPSNIILYPNMDCIAAIIDWEKEGFIPDPGDIYEGDDPVEEWSRPELADLFRGIGLSKDFAVVSTRLN